MHTLAHFRLDHTSTSGEQALKRCDAASAIISTWLVGKGASLPIADKGEFLSNTQNQRGRYLRSLIANAEGTLEETVLGEPTQAGQTFTTRILLVARGLDTHIFCTLSVHNTGTVIAPTQVYPRCPAVLKDIANSTRDWTIGTDVAPTELKVAAADEVISDILCPNRSVPVVLVSEIEGEPIWPRLAEDIAFDLICLARVYRISSEVSWSLTERLGKQESCYMGAVRIYWPLRTQPSVGTALHSHIWTPFQMLARDTDGKGAQRLRSALRELILTVSARTIEPPTAIRAIMLHERQAKLRELEHKTASISEELEIAKSYLADNEKLQERISELEGELASLQGRALAAEYALEQRGGPEEDEDSEESLDEASPTAGEIRYYKKTHSRPGYDVLVRVPACGHNSWQPANKADKAKKGIERLEGTNNWAQVNHCGSCTGGGLWRVKW
jgi:hypothetical protein